MWGWLGGHQRGRRSEGRGRVGKGHGKAGEDGGRCGRVGRQRYSGGGSDDDARRWFEFVSTRYHSSGSIWPRPPRVPRIVVSLPRASSSALCSRRSLSVELVISIRPLLSPSAVCRSRFFFVPRSVPDTRRAGPLRLSPPVALPPSQRLILSRQPHRFTFYVPPAVSLDLASSLSLSASILLHHTRAPRINPSPSCVPYLLSRTGSLVLLLAFSSARASLARSSVAAPLADPLSLCARQGLGTGR